MIKYIFLTVLFCALHGCGPEQDIPAKADYGKGENIKVIKFYAEWCPPCQAMKPEYEKAKKIYQYIAFEEVDLDRNQTIVSAYNITGVPVVIKQKNGKEIKRCPGYMSRNELVRFIEDN